MACKSSKGKGKKTTKKGAKYGFNLDVKVGKPRAEEKQYNSSFDQAQKNLYGKGGALEGTNKGFARKPKKKTIKGKGKKK